MTKPKIRAPERQQSRIPKVLVHSAGTTNQAIPGNPKRSHRMEHRHL